MSDKETIKYLEEKFEETIKCLEETKLTVAQIRAYLDGEELENLTNALDEAQGKIHEGPDKEKHILIKVTQ